MAREMKLQVNRLREKYERKVSLNANKRGKRHAHVTDKYAGRKSRSDQTKMCHQNINIQSMHQKIVIGIIGVSTLSQYTTVMWENVRGKEYITLTEYVRV